MPRRLSPRSDGTNASRTSAPTDARPAATHTGGATSSATRWTTNIRPQTTHRTTASTRVSSSRWRHSVALTDPALPGPAVRSPWPAFQPPARGEQLAHIVAHQRADARALAAADVAREPQRVELAGLALADPDPQLTWSVPPLRAARVRHGMRP